GMALQVAVGTDQHGAGFARPAPGQAQHLGDAVALDPGLVDPTQAAAAAPGQQAEGDVRGGGRAAHLRLTWRSSRRLRWTWRSVSSFFLPSYGLVPSRNSIRTGVPTSLKRLRKKFSR